MTSDASPDASAESLLDLAITHHQHGRFTQAYETFFKAASLYRTQKQPDLAAQTFRRLLRLETSDINLQLSLVENFIELGLHQDATEAFHLCADHGDTLQAVDRFFDIAELLSSLNADDEKLNRKILDILLRDTEIYINYRLFDKAKANLERGLRYYPDSIRIHEKMLGLIRESDTLEKQIPWLLKLANLTKDSDRQTTTQYLNRALTLADDPDDILNFAESIGFDIRHTYSINTLGDETTDIPTKNQHKNQHKNNYELEEILDDVAERPLRITIPTPVIENTENIENIENTESVAKMNVASLRERLSLRLNLQSKTTEVTPDQLPDKHYLAMLHDLLRTAEDCKTATAIVLQTSTPETGPRAEFFAFDKRLSANITLNGELITTISGTPPPPDEQYAIVTAALLKVGQAFNNLTFEIHQTPANIEITRDDTLSPIQLLMALTRAHSTDHELDGAYQFFNTTRPISENGWLFLPTLPGCDFPLPLESFHTSDINIATTELLGRVLATRETFLRKILMDQNNNRPLLSHVIVVDTSYSCLSSPNRIAVIQVANNHIGQALRIAQQLMDAP